MTLNRGDIAPDFGLPVLQATPVLAGGVLAEPISGEPASGEIWTLRDLLSRGPALLIFVKESCPTCQFALPFVDRIYRNYPDSKVRLVVIAQEEPDLANEMVQDLKLRIPVLLDRDPYPVSEEYGVTFVPTFFYITPDGTVETVIESFAREELNALNEKIARDNGLGSAIPFYKPGEDVPFFRPG